MSTHDIPSFGPLCRSAFAILLLTLFLASCSAPASGGKPIVLCTIFSYYDAARAIAGDAADVQILLPPNTSPHEYHLRPEDKFTAARAKLFIKNGLGLDDNFSKLVDDPRATTVLTMGDAIPRSEFLHGSEEDHPPAAPVAPTTGESLNPHIWLDPTVQIAAAEKIRDALITLDPAHRAAFEANAKTYIARLQQLDADFKAAAATFKSKKFIGFHSAYDYLARRYGLEQIASIEDVAGSGLTGDKLRQVIDLIKKNNMKYFAVETALSGPGADKIKLETGAEPVVLQPLETYETTQDTYESLMRQNLAALKKILGT